MNLAYIQRMPNSAVLQGVVVAAVVAGIPSVASTVAAGAVVLGRAEMVVLTERGLGWALAVIEPKPDPADTALLVVSWGTATGWARAQHQGLMELKGAGWVAED